MLMVALGVNIGMSLLKLGVGLISGSLAVIADAMHSGTDALSSLTGLIANTLSDPRPDRDHPYGHHKYEAVGALGIAGFILFTALEILLSSGERLLEGLPPAILHPHAWQSLLPSASSFSRRSRQTVWHSNRLAMP